MDIHSTRTLHNGVQIPLLGLGTWQILSGPQAENVVGWALESGYRHIDTAAAYDNEQSVGRAIERSSIPHNELFVTTKLWNTDHLIAEKAFATSLKKLNLSYVDLYLVHYPISQTRIQAWKSLEKIAKTGQARAIGVSNFTVSHLKELLEQCEIVPAVNQVEFSPFLFQKELLEYCQKNKIQLTAYSPLTRGLRLDDDRLLDLADRYRKTPAQLLIRWAIQHEIVVIPKSSQKGRIIENGNVFDFSLTAKHMDVLDNFNENFRVCWDPTKET